MSEYYDEEAERYTVPVIFISDNQGYSPDQVRSTMTLREMADMVNDMIEEYGEDTEVTTHNGQRYGAQFGGFVQYESSGW